MDALEQVGRLWRHAVWADERVLDALRAGVSRGSPPPAAALREYAHILGAEEVWLARLEGRAPRAAVWPELTVDGAAALAAAVRDGYAALLARLAEGGGADALGAPVAYTNSAGQSFVTAAGDILLHVALHGQYHRGKVNLLLREAGLEPAPADYVAFVRGAPAATQADAARRSAGG